MKARLQGLLRNRSVLLTVAGLGLLALFLLAAGLNGMDLQPPEQFVAPGEKTDLYSLLNQLSDTSLIEQLLFISMLVMLFAILLVFLSPESRKRVLLATLRFIILIGLVYLVLQRSKPVELPQPLEGPAAAAPGESPEQVGTVVEFQEPPMPPWFIYLTSLAIVGALIGGGWWWWRRMRPRTYLPLREYATIAREALDGLSSGRDWRDTIIKCYVRMGEVVREERGLDRTLAMTASEFSVQLVRSGLPAEPVKKLTRLFELVRYGEQTATPEQVNEAVDCLTAIARACGAENL